MSVSAELARLREELGPLSERDLALLNFSRIGNVEQEISELKARIDSAPRAGDTAWCKAEAKRLDTFEERLDTIEDDVLVFKTKEKVLIAAAGIGGSVAGSVVTALILYAVLGSAS